MGHAGVNVIIVDDEPLIRVSLSYLLTEMGYRVRTAEDGLSALAELRKEIPDILLSDLNMPGMSGFELLQEIRCRFPSIKTIAMSGAFSGNEVPFGVAADAFHPKGCGVDSLLQIVESLLRSRRIQSNNPAALALSPIQPREQSPSEEA